MEIESKICYVVDAQGGCVTNVRLDFVPVYLPPPLLEDGTPDYPKMETRMEWVPYYYKLKEGERIVETSVGPPQMRWEDGAITGILRERWDDEAAAWAEAATAEEIAAWGTEHPKPPPRPPTAEEQLRADVDFLSALQGVTL